MNEYLTTTMSICRDCGKLIPARVHLGEDGVWFYKDCPNDGRQSVRLWSDAQQYLELDRFHRAGSVPHEFAGTMEKGCPYSCGLCPEHEQHVCMPIIEITDHCDLSCPVCLVKNRSSFHLTRQQVAKILDQLIASEGQINVVNLSGGEPLLNPEFRQIVEECLSRKEILYLSVSTNGLVLERDLDMLKFLAERRVIISLQFDGFCDDVYSRLRGQPLLEKKQRLIDTAARLDARMSLTMTVARDINDDQLGRVLELLFDRDNICSVMFQPVAYTGRAASMQRPTNIVTIPDVIRSLEGACGGLISSQDFSPLPCSHPACFSLAYYLRVEGKKFLPIKRLVPIDRYLDMIQNRALFGTDQQSFEQVKQAVYDLWSGPAALAPDSQEALSAARRLLQSVSTSSFGRNRITRVVERSIKSVFIHHFMDRNTFDLSRARKCCNVYPLANGRLMPACVYNCLWR